MRPLVSITYMDFLMLGLDPLVNYAAKLRYKTGGQLRAPMVVKTTAGAKGQGVAHSQCIEAWLMGVPGLKVVAPSTPADAYGLLESALRRRRPRAVRRSQAPVSHRRASARGTSACRFGQAIVRRARHRRDHRHALATCAASRDEAAEPPRREGVACEIVDLRTLAPLDVATVAASAARTGALVTLEEGQVDVRRRRGSAVPRARELGTLRVARVGAARGAGLVRIRCSRPRACRMRTGRGGGRGGCCYPEPTQHSRHQDP